MLADDTRSRDGTLKRLHEETSLEACLVSSKKRITVGPPYDKSGGPDAQNGDNESDDAVLVVENVTENPVPPLPRTFTTIKPLKYAAIAANLRTPGQRDACTLEQIYTIHTDADRIRDLAKLAHSKRAMEKQKQAVRAQNRLDSGNKKQPLDTIFSDENLNRMTFQELLDEAPRVLGNIKQRLEQDDRIKRLVAPEGDAALVVAARFSSALTDLNESVQLSQIRYDKSCQKGFCVVFEAAIFDNLVARMQHALHQ